MLSASQAIGLKLFLFILAVIVVVLKQAVRWWLQTKFGWTDIFITLCVALYLAEEVIAIELHRLDFFNMPVANFSVNGYPDLLKNAEVKDKLSIMLRLLFFSSFVTFTIFWAIKAAFMALYTYLVPPWLTGLRWSIHATSILVFLSYIGFLVSNVFSCGNVAANWSTDPEEFCFSFSRKAGVIYLTTLHLLTDIIIFIIPFFILPHIMLPTAEKWGLALMFALGLLTICCTVARTAIVLSAKSFTYHDLLTWDSGEITCGLIVVCAPSIKWLILWATGHKRRRAIRAFHGHPEESSSDMTSRAGTSRIGRAARRDTDSEDDDIRAMQTLEPIAVVVKHEISVDIESLRANREEAPSTSSSSKDVSGVGAWPDKPPRSFLHL
ncbi:hypothetical protein TWF506_006067 [Arthrobotrys conoides]|uniref:Rhodopsin domain-containing protein n=1 Tax=Arthrobotrys conoides TaxID=74498 RepID=A0AAN8NLF8_9PEZI